MTGQANAALVSVVIPMLNELGYIEPCLEGFANQTHPLDRLEVIVVDGGSTDGSRAVVDDWAREHRWIRVVDNPDRRASAAFNRGVEAAQGDVVCLFSAHGVPSPTYLEHSVSALAATGASGVGGQYHHIGVDPTTAAIGRAMVSPFGMASPHRFARDRREVDTISHPAYCKQALVEVGPFDETLLRNSDYELNHRLRELGHRLVFDPSIESIYRPRPSLTALARQFWHYGRWKARVARRHPASLRPRHLVAPAAVVIGAVSPLLALTRTGRWVLIFAGAGYGLALAVALRLARPREHGANPAVLAASFPIMHTCWGAGFVASVLEDAARRRSS